jgi:PAS domain S-box-containing protein
MNSRMTRPDSDLAFLRDPRLASQATAAFPAWLWSTDGKQILWANPVGAAIFGGETPAALAERNFSGNPLADQIARLAGSLSHASAARLERLRGIVPGIGRVLTCACSRITVENHSYILVTAVEPAGPNLPLAERARRLFAHHDEPVAVFAADGALLHATPAAEDFLNEARSLEALGVDALAAQAVQEGRADGEFTGGRVAIRHLGSAASAVLIASFTPRPAEIDISPIALAMARAAAAPPPQSEPPLIVMPAASAAAETTAPAAPPSEAAMAERRHPLRFVWQMDAEGHFTLGSDEFAEIMGPTIATAFGRPWSEIAAQFNLDPNGEVARAIASRDTWSGLIVSWPIEGSDERLEIELSGLPIFERDRTFRGYRGFGVCRDITRLSALAAARRTTPPTAAPPAAATEQSNVEIAPVPLRAEQPPQTEVHAANVVAFPSPAPAEPKTLSPVEHTAFRELARRLSDRLRGDETAPAVPAPAEKPATALPPANMFSEAEDRRPADEKPLLDRLPAGILVYRPNELLYANAAFLDATGYPTLEAFAESGGFDSLLLGETNGHEPEGTTPLVITTESGEERPAQARLFTIPWEGQPASALIFAEQATAATLATTSSVETKAQVDNTALLAAQAENKELETILDNAADAIVVLDREGKILGFNRGAENLFGYSAEALASRHLGDLFAPESERSARNDLDGLARNVPNDGREVIGRLRQGGLIPLFMTMGRISEKKFCAVFRDVTQWKRAEEELIDARRQAEKASSAKSEFLAKISHEIRTPLNAILGFSEVMMEERFGPIANDRYRDYLKDIHVSGGHVISLLNDLLDLSKIEAGKVELNFAGLDLNALTQQCVTMMQPQANKERIIIRTSLPASIPAVVADARSVRQIVLNLLSNSIKYTRAGGQVIVSTAMTDHGEVALRVRDTGVGMSEKDIQTALEPFRQLATSVRPGTNGTGLGLPLTKALAEANRAHFKIKSAVDDGTLVEVSFPRARAAAE